MSTLVLNDPVSGGRRPGAQRLNRFFRPFAEFIGGFRLARAMARRYELLATLSNAELAARSIRREDIPSLVVNGKYDI
jgi:hypothetical protein